MRKRKQQKKKTKEMEIKRRNVFQALSQKKMKKINFGPPPPVV
jgi:hypothetical protein